LYRGKYLCNNQIASLAQFIDTCFYKENKYPILFLNLIYLTHVLFVWQHLINFTCKLLGPGNGLCLGDKPPPWIASMVSVNCRALKFNSRILSWTESGLRITLPDPPVSKLPSNTSVWVVWDNLRKYILGSSSRYPEIKNYMLI
jgi:hypothetical protein